MYDKMTSENSGKHERRMDFWHSLGIYVLFY